MNEPSVTNGSEDGVHFWHDTRKECHYYTTLGRPLTVYSSDRACPCHAHLPLPRRLAIMSACPCHARHLRSKQKMKRTQQWI